VKLERIPMELLILLVEKDGKVVTFLQSESIFRFLHSDPRFQTLVKKVGLPPVPSPALATISANANLIATASNCGHDVYQFTLRERGITLYDSRAAHLQSKPSSAHACRKHISSGGFA